MNTAKEKCPDCNGFGEIPQKIKCSYCKGTGVRDGKSCSTCKGYGTKTLWHRCARCKGSGVMTVKLNVMATYWPQARAS